MFSGRFVKKSNRNEVLNSVSLHSFEQFLQLYGYSVFGYKFQAGAVKCWGGGRAGGFDRESV